MLEDIKKLVGEHIEAAKKHDVEYLPWDVTNAFLLVKLSEQVASLQEASKPSLRHLQEEDQHDGIMIAFMLDPGTARQLAIPGGEDPGEMHITLAYLGKVDDLRYGVEHLKHEVELFVNAMTPIYFSGNIGGVGRFVPSEHSDNLSPIVALVNVHGLQAFRMNLKSALGSSGINVANNYDYLPHITLCYVDPNAPMPVQNIEPLPLSFDTLWLCIGDQRISYKLGEIPHAQEEKNTQDQKTGVETLPEDDRRVDGGPWSAEELEWFKKNYTGEVTSESLGDPLDWSDAYLDKLAAIGDEDITSAIKLWDDNAEGFAGLLNAEVADEQA